jgi:hypothetical protein
MDLLICHTEQFGELLLGDTKNLPTFTDSHPDQLIGG